MKNYSIVNGHLVFLYVAIRYMLWPFGTFCGHSLKFFPVLVYCTKKDLATLIMTKNFIGHRGRSSRKWPRKKCFRFCNIKKNVLFCF
jgi:hypothetical protein